MTIDHDDMPDALDALLAEATDGLREETAHAAAASEEAASTRTAIRNQLTARRPTSRWMAAAAFALAFLGLPSALAYFTGVLPAIAEGLGLIAPVQPPAPPSDTPQSRTRRTPRRQATPSVAPSPLEGEVAPATEESPLIEPSEPAPVATAETNPTEPMVAPSAPTRRPRNGRRNGRPTREPAEPTDTTAEPPGNGEDAAGNANPVDHGERTAFADAHAVHFEQHRPQAALRAWNAYLDAYPHGIYEPEARYNRALTLVRLGRHQAAMDALQPFAAGRFGSTRRTSANALLEALLERQATVESPPSPSVEGAADQGATDTPSPASLP